MNGIASISAGAVEKEEAQEVPDIGSIKLEDAPAAVDGSQSNENGLKIIGDGGGVRTATEMAATKKSPSAKSATVITAGKSVDHPNYKEKMQLQNGPPPARVKALLDRSGYTVEVTPYMRKFGGPPPDASPRPIGTELYVGKLAKQCFEDEVYPLFEPFGKIWEIRIITDPETQNGRGFGFVTYAAPESCPKAVSALNEKPTQTETGRKLTLIVTHNQHRIFVGSIPKEKNRQDLLDAFKPELEGLIDVIVHSAGEESGEKFRNRGFCFLEFDTFDHANFALQRIQLRKTNPFKHRIFGNWAQTQQEPDEETMKCSKVLFLDNLTNEQSEQVLNDLFKPYAGFVHVKKSYAYAFARFDTRDNAEKALTDILSGKLQAGGAALNATWARPDRSSSSNKSNRYNNYGSRYYGGSDYYYYDRGYYSSPRHWNQRSDGRNSSYGTSGGGNGQQQRGGANNVTARGGGGSSRNGGAGRVPDNRGRYNGNYGGDINSYYYYDDYNNRQHYYADDYNTGGRHQSRYGTENRGRGGDDNAFYAAHHYIPPPPHVSHHPHSAVYAPAYGYTYAPHPPHPHYGPPHAPPPPHFHQYMAPPAAAVAVAAAQACWPAYRRNYPHAQASSNAYGGPNPRGDPKVVVGRVGGASRGGVKRPSAATQVIGRGGAANGGAANTSSNGDDRSPPRSGVPPPPPTTTTPTYVSTPALYTQNSYGTVAPVHQSYGGVEYSSSSAYVQHQQQHGSGVYPPQQVNSGLKQHASGGGGDGQQQQSYQPVMNSGKKQFITTTNEPDGTYAGGGVYAGYGVNEDGFQRF